MKHFSFILFLLVVLLSACHTSPRFKVVGNISEAADSTIYLDYLALKETVAVDSCVVKENGEFCLKAEAPQYPDLYRLRVGKKQLILAIDSAETIHLQTSLSDFPYADVSGSEKTRQLTTLRRSIRSVTIDEHKQFARQLILQDPRSQVAYYALFQQKNGQWVFDLYAKEDRSYFAAVATAWHTFMPDNERGKVLYKLVNDAIKTERKEHNLAMMHQFIEQSESAFLDINLPDEKGNMKMLSSLRGNVILLDFSAMGMENANAYVFELRELYNAYHQKGLNIYSVSVDANQYLWEDSAHNLPWITVRGDEEQTSVALRTYNVQQVPTLFLFDKQGQIVSRYTDFSSLKKDIEACLR